MPLRKSIIQNFPAYINNYGSLNDDVSTDPKKMPGEILEELNQIRFKKPYDGPEFSPNLLHPLRIVVILSIATGIQISV